MIDARKNIVFRNPDYTEKFRIKDGDSIKITVAYDGEVLIRKCRFLDDMHMNIVNTCYHMDEFIGKSDAVGNKYEPAPGMEPKLDILYSEPGQLPVDMEIPISMAALENLLGGRPITTPLDKSSAIVWGENGNGSYAVLGLNEDNLSSLHPYKAQSYKHHHTEISQIAAEKKPSLLGQLADAKKAAAAVNKSADGIQPLREAGKNKPVETL